jgi:hypothetical protein
VDVETRLSPLGSQGLKQQRRKLKRPSLNPQPQPVVLTLLASAMLVAGAGGGNYLASGGSKDYLLASGRWDNTVVVIDVEKALNPANDATPNAVINRLRVTPDIDATGSGKLDTVASGQPIGVAISADQRRAYVSNHSGQSTLAQAASFQHGWPDTYTVVDLEKALDPANNGTLNAVVTYIDGKNFGATGFAISPDQKYAAAAAAETPDSEDGGRATPYLRISL